MPVTRNFNSNKETDAIIDKIRQRMKSRFIRDAIAAYAKRKDIIRKYNKVN